MKILQRFIPFFLSFLIGSLFVSLFVSTQNSLINLQQTSNIQSQNSPSNTSKLTKCFDLLSELKRRKFELVQERANLIIWLEKNGNTSKKQKSDKNKKILSLRNKIRETHIEIESLESGIEFRKEYPEETGVVTNLLLRKNCY